MRLSSVVFAIMLSLSTAACDSLNTTSDVPVAHGSYMLSSHDLTGNGAVAVQFGGKVFHISKNTITWNRGGSTPLTSGWGLLELEESPSGILVNLDGVKAAEVAK